MAIRLLIDLGELVKVALKRWCWEMEYVGGLRGMGDTRLCSPCSCLSVFLLCSGGYLCQGLQRAGIEYIWNSRLVSRCECVGGRGSW
jgi:hypothetical protein